MIEMSVVSFVILAVITCMVIAAFLFSVIFLIRKIIELTIYLTSHINELNQAWAKHIVYLNKSWENEMSQILQESNMQEIDEMDEGDDN